MFHSHESKEQTSLRAISDEACSVFLFLNNNERTALCIQQAFSNQSYANRSFPFFPLFAIMTDSPPRRVSVCICVRIVLFRFYRIVLHGAACRTIAAAYPIVTITFPCYRLPHSITSFPQYSALDYKDLFDSFAEMHGIGNDATGCFIS